MVRTALVSELEALCFAVSISIINNWFPPAAHANILPSRGWNRKGLAENNDLEEA